MTKISFRTRRKRPKRSIQISKWHPGVRQVLNWLIIFTSAFLCLLMLPTRFPGMEILGMGPNWLLIWVVAWSVKRSMFSAASAGVILGLIQDGMTNLTPDSMTAPLPSHALSLAIVGILTSRLKKQRYIEEDFISVALIVFGMVVVAEMVFALELASMNVRSWAEIWTDFQSIALASAILSSLWAPVIYYPLNNWWKQINFSEQKF